MVKASKKGALVAATAPLVGLGFVGLVVFAIYKIATANEVCICAGPFCMCGKRPA